MAAGRDAGNRGMQRAGRTAWVEEDFDVAAEVVGRLLGSSAPPLLSRTVTPAAG